MAVSWNEIVRLGLGLLCLLAAHSGQAQTRNTGSAESGPPGTSPSSVTNTAAAIAVRAEAIRTSCIAGRRLICGRVLQVLSDGVVVESGYTSLLREPVQRSWLVPGTVTASRDPTLVEAKEPGAVCAGLVFLTDLPKRKRSPAKVKPFDYVILQAYPAGEYTYHSVGNIQRTVRRFSAGLETAVKLTLESSAVETAPKRYGMDARPKTKAYLEMPEAAGGAVPRLLSQTGAFTDTQNLVPSPSLVPYDLNVHFWSDGAAKGRWMALPNDEHHPDTKIAFHPAGEWAFPKGTVFVKHFELATNELRAELRRR